VLQYQLVANQSPGQLRGTCAHTCLLELCRNCHTTTTLALRGSSLRLCCRYFSITLASMADAAQSISQYFWNCATCQKIERSSTGRRRHCCGSVAAHGIDDTFPRPDDLRGMTSAGFHSGILMEGFESQLPAVGVRQHLCLCLELPMSRQPTRSAHTTAAPAQQLADATLCVCGFGSARFVGMSACYLRKPLRQGLAPHLAQRSSLSSKPPNARPMQQQLPC